MKLPILEQPEDAQPDDKKVISEFIKRLKNWRLNDLQQWLMGMARRAVPGPDQKAQIAWANKRVQGLLDQFPSRRGRPRTGAQTPAMRQRRYRQRKNDWDWLPFPIIAHAGYLVIETSPEEDIALFDIHRAHIVIGFELQRMMDAHHRDYPDQKTAADQPEQHGTEFETELSQIKVLVLQYPDKILYIAPAYETPPSVADTLAGVGLSSLNRGLFLADAPKGKGKLIKGWGHKKGYNKNTSGFEPSLDDTSDFYADEFAVEDDDADIPVDHPEGWGNRAMTEDELDEQFKKSELDEPVKEPELDDERITQNLADESTNESESENKCRICNEVLEGDDDDDTLLLKHLNERHPDEYQRICRSMEEQFEKKRKAEKKHERRLLEKQKRCREDHDGIFARTLKTHGPGAYYCKHCDAPLCKGTHEGQVAEVLTERNAYRAKLSYLEQLDANKARPAPIRCKYCHKPILVTEYEG